MQLEANTSTWYFRGICVWLKQHETQLQFSKARTRISKRHSTKSPRISFSLTKYTYSPPHYHHKHIVGYTPPPGHSSCVYYLYSLPARRDIQKLNRRCSWNPTQLPLIYFTTWLDRSPTCTEDTPLHTSSKCRSDSCIFPALLFSHDTLALLQNSPVVARFYSQSNETTDTTQFDTCALSASLSRWTVRWSEPWWTRSQFRRSTSHYTLWKTAHKLARSKESARVRRSGDPACPS